MNTTNAGFRSLDTFNLHGTWDDLTAERLMVTACSQ